MREAEFSEDEVNLSLPRPGGDAWLRISLPDGQAEYERTDRAGLVLQRPAQRPQHRRSLALVY